MLSGTIKQNKFESVTQTSALIVESAAKLLEHPVPARDRAFSCLDGVFHLHAPECRDEAGATTTSIMRRHGSLSHARMMGKVQKGGASGYTPVPPPAFSLSDSTLDHAYRQDQMISGILGIEASRRPE